MRILCACTGVALALIACSTSSAQVFNEVGDATDLLPGQLVTVGTTQIVGTVDAGDPDLYAFDWTGGELVIDTLGSDFDTQLHLFDGAGFGIGENDDAVGLLSELAFDLDAGNYFIGITGFNNDALDENGNPIFGFNNTFNDLNGNFIQGPEGNGALAAWDGGGGAGSYNINFSAPVGVPEPTSAFVLLGALGSAMIRRRR